MRSRSLVLLLALAGTALSGCASGFDDAYTQSSIPGQPGGNNGTDTGGDGISGDTNGNGEGNEVTLSGGDTTLAYTDGARSTDGGGRAQLVVSANGQSATVAVDPGVAMGFTGSTTMARYLEQTGADRSGQASLSIEFDNPNYPVTTNTAASPPPPTVSCRSGTSPTATTKPTTPPTSVRLRVIRTPGSLAAGTHR
jgi:hypothetical protein